jgi:hypothetical protein
LEADLCEGTSFVIVRRYKGGWFNGGIKPWFGIIDGGDRVVADGAVAQKVVDGGVKFKYEMGKEEVGSSFKEGDVTTTGHLLVPAEAVEWVLEGWNMKDVT